MSRKREIKREKTPVIVHNNAILCDYCSVWHVSGVTDHQRHRGSQSDGRPPQLSEALTLKPRFSSRGSELHHKQTLTAASVSGASLLWCGATQPVSTLIRIPPLYNINNLSISNVFVQAFKAFNHQGRG